MIRGRIGLSLDAFPGYPIMFFLSLVLFLITLSFILYTYKSVWPVHPYSMDNMSKIMDNTSKGVDNTSIKKGPLGSLGPRLLGVRTDGPGRWRGA